jgi:hypothetical protein
MLQVVGDNNQDFTLLVEQQKSQLFGLTRQFDETVIQKTKREF